MDTLKCSYDDEEGIGFDETNDSPVREQTPIKEYRCKDKEDKEETENSKNFIAICREKTSILKEKIKLVKEAIKR